MKNPLLTVGFWLVICGAPIATAQATQIDYDAAIQALASRSSVSEGLQFIRDLESTSERVLIELTEIPAPPFGEERRAQRFAELLRGLGLGDVRVDQVGNVVARRRGVGGGEAVAIVAHLDTVFPQNTDVTVRRRGGRLYAPGIGDDTRGLVLLLNLARALERLRVQTVADILFVGSVGEEGVGDLRGVRYLLQEEGARIDQFIAIDGGSDSRIVNQALGSRRYIVRVIGPGGHSWGDFGRANPAHALSRAIYYFDVEASEVVNSGQRASYNIGRIGGGTSVNSVPHEAWAEVDMRSVDPEQVDRLERALRLSVERALDEQNRTRGSGAALLTEFELIGDRPSGSVPRGVPLVERALAATKFLGLRPELGAASTDANLAIAAGIPAVTLSRGGQGGGAHSPDEWWSSRNAHVGVQRALLVLLASAGLAE
ncbi:MAG: peptidase M20 [Acidobacteria bacterium]|nr:peptidase M20 [Acidobacteriota bacterium]|tara:strand:+ start:7584 stop:8870 length:1287 start_codon:yes stop_codon:yes gene_type:complete